MLKPLIWGSLAPEWEDEIGLVSQQSSSQHSTVVAATAAAAVAGREGLKRENRQDFQPQHPKAAAAASAALSNASPRPRGIYDPNRGAALLGPLSVNDPQLELPDRGDRFVLSESFLNIASPFGPLGAGNDWRMQRKDAPEHAHRLLRALMAAQDYAGAARALATLHRLHSVFDPDVYRFTVALLRLSGDHQKTSMYFRKVLGKKARSVRTQKMLEGRAVAHDFMAYLADRQKFDEALNVSQNILEGRSLSRYGALKLDPSLRAHGALLHLFAALLEHQAFSSKIPEYRLQVSGTAAAAATVVAADGASADGASPQVTGAGDGAAASVGRHRQHRRIQVLQDPLSLIGRLRSCLRECTTAAAGTDSPQGRAREHLKSAKRLLDQSAMGLPGNASVAGYQAAVTAAESGTVAALQQLAHFVERNPESVKGRRLHARLLEMSLREAHGAAAAVGDGGGGGGGSDGHREMGRRAQRQEHEVETEGSAEPGRGKCSGCGDQAAGDGERDPQHEKGEAAHDDGDGDDRLLLAGVARARALRGWLETDPLEPRAALGLAALHAAGSAAVVGVADRAFVIDGLIGQLETSVGLPRPCPSAAGGCGRGILHTTRAGMALWAALADLLGPLRVRDEPVPVTRFSAAAAAPPPPRPGTIWDQLYGADPPWAPTDFAHHQSKGGGGSGLGDDGAGGVSAAEAGEAKGENVGSDAPGVLSAPHPLLRGVDGDLWEETVLDPDGEPLLLVADAKSVARGGSAPETSGCQTWCSADEDCASGDESELLQECARLASRRTGGCLYYVPPGGEEGLRARISRRGGGAGGGGGGGGGGEGGGLHAARRRARPFFKTKIAEIVLEGMAGEAREGEGDASHVEEEEEDEEEEDEDEDEDEEDEERRENGKEKRRLGRWTSGPGSRAGRKQMEVTGNLDGDKGRESPDDAGGGSTNNRGSKRRRLQREGAEMKGPYGGPIKGRSGFGSSDRCNNRRDLESEDDAVLESLGMGIEGGDTGDEDGDGSDPDWDGDDDDDKDEDEDEVEDEDEDDDEVVTSTLREPEAPRRRPVGTDAAATSLSETISVILPEEAAVWLLVDKCLVAAHLFGPQHRYCLRAIGRLCREDVREAARPARAALRSLGFRLQLSLTRLAADNARIKAAEEGRGSGVSWGLPEPPAAARNVLPFDSYVPEPVGSSTAAAGGIRERERGDSSGSKSVAAMGVGAAAYGAGSSICSRS